MEQEDLFLFSFSDAGQAKLAAIAKVEPDLHHQDGAKALQARAGVMDSATTLLSSLPGAQSLLTAKSSITLDHSTAPRRSPRAWDQNLSRPNSSHNRHPSQQSPNLRGRRTAEDLRGPTS